MAETFTDKLKLSKRDTGDLNWGEGSNANLDLLDSHGQQGTLRPPRTLLASLGSGAVGAELVGSTTYFYKITAFNASGETRENQFPSVFEAQITEPGTPVPVVLQWDTVKGAAGYRIYKSTTSGQEKFLVEVTGEATATYTDDGNTAVNTGISVPTANTALTALSGLRKTGETDFLRGDVELEAGPNITLTQDGPNKKITVEAAGGGGGGGYATVVVEAPTGVASTDTANINAALTTAAGGGRVVLREGTYRIDSLLTIPDHVVFEGQGKKITIIEADPAMEGGMLQSSGSDHQIKHITFDANHDAPRGGTNTFNEYFFNTSNMYIEDCEFLDTHSTIGVMFNKGGSLQDRAIIRNCRFETKFGALSSGIISGGQLVEGCEFFQDGTVAGTIAHFISGVDLVRNCFFEHSSGTFTRAVLLSVGQSAIGNWVRSMTGTVIEISGGTNNVIVQSNYLGGNGNIVVQSGVTDSVVMGNTGTANVTDNSGSGTNSISDNK